MKINIEECLQEEKPVYWNCSLQDVEITVQEVKKGKVHILRSSAGGRPVYMIEYGTSNLPPSHATLSSALGAGNYAYYADKGGDDYRPAVFLAGCIHGGEFEGTVAILNLIHLLETGKDYAGNTNHELLDLAEKVHLLLMPMCNPDGRSHVPFDNFVGRTIQESKYFNQGTWKDGTLCGWPQCKKYFPIKDYVDYLGGYYNDDGVNIMHDDFFGHKAAETSNILDVCRIYAPDVSVLFHGANGNVNHVTVPGYVSGKAKKQNYQLVERTVQAFKAADYKFWNNRELHLSYDKEQAETQQAFNLISAMHHCCGEMCVTYETNQGTVGSGTYWMDNEGIYLSHNIFIKCVLEHVTERKKR